MTKSNQMCTLIITACKPVSKPTVEPCQKERHTYLSVCTCIKTKLWSDFNCSCCLRCLLLMCSTHFIYLFLFQNSILICGRIAKQKPEALNSFGLCLKSLGENAAGCACFSSNTEMSSFRTTLLATQRFRSRCSLILTDFRAHRVLKPHLNIRHLCIYLHQS